MWRTRALGAALVAILSLPAATNDIPDPQADPTRSRASSDVTGAGPASDIESYRGDEVNG